MSSFDEAFRRQLNDQRTRDADQRSKHDRRYKIAEAAVPAVTQMLRDFYRTLRDQGVLPTRLELDHPRGRFRPKRKYSPEGYVVHLYMGLGGNQYPTRLSLVTPDARLWRFEAPEPGEFVPITPEILLTGDFALEYATVLDDGRIGVSEDAGYDVYSIETLLARQAQKLIEQHQLEKRRSSHPR